MLKQTINFKDFNGVEREETLYFNLTEAELVDMQADSEEGIQKDMMDAVKAKDMRKLLDFVKMLVHGAYGVRDKDGIHFHKSPEITAAFVNSAMYSPLLLSLFQDEGTRAEQFINGLMPADLVAAAIAQSQGQGTQAAPESSNYAPDARTLFAQQQAQRAAAEEGHVNEATPVGVPAAPIQTTPSTQDAAPVQVGQTDETPAQEAPRSFRVKETPMDEGAAQAKAEQKAAEDAEFQEWKRKRDAGEL